MRLKAFYTVSPHGPQQLKRSDYQTAAKTSNTAAWKT